jgi:ABC-2 type transport system ATP-binding protein
MVQLENIDFGYKGNRLLFNDLSLSTESGSIYGLLGKNGAGKTTLLKIISGLRKAHKGKTVVTGYNPSDRNLEFLEQIFFIPEELYLPSMQFKNYVSQFSGFYPAFDLPAFKGYLNSFDLDWDMHLGHLSFGQKKKFLLSFAMATGARLVLFDEPTNGLDIPSKSVFRKLAASAITVDRTFIISTHQVRDLSMLIDSVMLIDRGKILLNDKVSAIAEKFAFVTLPRNHGRTDLLYSEEQLEGIKAIILNNDKSETFVDLELLFNATANKTFLDNCSI